MGDCSAATICADGESHLGVCSQDREVREGQDRYLTSAATTPALFLRLVIECWGQNMVSLMPDTIQDAIAVSAGDTQTLCNQR